ncbi:hypothetical protein PENTCL1PPCAC_16118 [Pristionchus entomophagus]|uniref:Uncharacterized protein n=1 Tax=Pristionchus entomophagus TaxID=358040 RepID=A0AAV5THX6_9BILA|nr:hypothetical protein PENTCL1PPCAC_16118 [Pristionchus entomophagus]
MYPMFEVDSINMIYLQGIIMPLIFFVLHRNKRSTEIQMIAMNTVSGEDLILTYDGVITKGW